MARLTLANLATKINSFFADNIGRLITPAKLREQQTDIKDSFTHLDTFEAHTGATNNPHAVTKSQVGLGNCDDTSDLNKPISVATQQALDEKIGFEINPQSGATLSFAKRAVYGDYGSPITAGTINFDGGGAVLGTVVRMIHQAGSEPGYNGAYHKMQSSRPYSNGQRNYYEFVYIANGRVQFKIDQE